MQYLYIYEYSTFNIFHCIFLPSQRYGNFVIIKNEQIIVIFIQSIDQSQF